MELNLRKARKLEAKILTYVNAMSPLSTVRVRALASDTERAVTLATGRDKYFADLYTQQELILTRFLIRKDIAKANHSVGINDLINYREQLQALLEKTDSKLETLDEKEVADLAMSKKLQLEKGEGRGYGETSVTFAVPVTTAEDVKVAKAKASQFKTQLEEVEDLLSQKNLGAKITLSEDTFKLLQSVGLL